jgi:two-component system, cell cycle sensor histidine kinase PleC
MNEPPRHPLVGLPTQEWDLRAAPAFEVDAAAGVILGANEAGWRAWGLDPAAVALPLPVDRAMPAFGRLGALAAGGEEQRQDETLTFWTARGLLQMVCRVEVLGAGTHFVVRSARPEAPRDMASSEPETKREGQVGDVALTARLAHELRTPLSAVIAYAEVLKDEHFGPLANARYLSYARDIYQSARHALGVVDAMLGGDARQAGERELTFTDLEPAVVTEGCVALARPLAEGAGLELEANYASGLPRVIADEVSLRQMLLNLLTNAVKFARPGDRVAVAVACQEGGPLHITVADTGPGMVPEASRGACDAVPVVRGKGLGLGLPLTRALAAANGATLLIDSAPGKGTRATISFGKDRLIPV